MKGRIRKAWLLAGRQPVEFVQDGGKTSLKLPAAAPGGLATVICLELE